ncbi:cysteine desulfurase [Herbiconiux sp. CPCC 205716]|uniref:Cysteine desulfurase n=1 Tax=Herbiconiux gentiana TaxID=2970912 RepID=A0ABT2GDH8_9MICO|nr:cysteine desulfurase family protein [Herbiconiux gentiana]MCS5714279.1 cysteine desulfurase [Herbiconiux gentiana]
MIHLDAAATTPVRREVLEAMWPYLTGEFGNPSSHHALGDAAARALRAARATVAEWFGCRAADVVFTSGGTEGANLAVKGLALGSPRGRHVVLSAIEHPAVVESVDHLRRLHGFEVTVVPVDSAGLVDPAAFAAALRDDTTLATVMLANNEIGTVQPVTELAAIAHARGALFHTDAVQAAGWLDLRLDRLGADAVSISGHKLGAPKGIGAVAVRGRLPLEPVLHGGGQERGRRSGTENVAFAVGLARAVELAEPGRVAAAARATALRDEFVGEVLRRVDGAVLTGHPDARLPSIASFCFPGTAGEAVLLGLEERGVTVSSGSACAAGSDEPSPVLLAIGLDPAVARTAVRFAFGHDVTAADLGTAVQALEATLASLATLR